MDASMAIELGREAVMLTLLLAAPALIAALVVGLVVSLFQAVTQVQEHTLSFVPKIIAVLIVAMLTGPWVLSRLVAFGQRMFGELP